MYAFVGTDDRQPITDGQQKTPQAGCDLRGLVFAAEMPSLSVATSKVRPQ
jgi:hypothetical protein